VVEHRPQPERALHVAPAAFDLQQLLVGRGQVVRCEGGVAGAQQPLAVQMMVALHRGGVDAQQLAGGAAQVAAQPGLGLWAPDELVAAPVAPAVRAGDQRLQMGEVPRPQAP
jgi:hypothetical protein